MNNKIKAGIIAIILISIVPQTNARPLYAMALQNTYLQSTYGIDLCLKCHINPNSSMSLTDYGNKFRSQPIFKDDPVKALKAIGSPDLNDTNTTVTLNSTAIPTANVTITAENESHEKESAKKAPGFEIFMSAGIIPVIYLLNKKRLIK